MTTAPIIIRLAGVPVDADLVRHLLDYNPATGRFAWRFAHAPRAVVGATAGTIDRKGYRRIKVNGKKFAAHRLAWIYMTGAWPPAQVDHKNRIRDDNRWDNLRSATPTQNCLNLIHPRSAFGKLKGAYLCQNGRWQASITVDAKLIYLGRFDSELDAHEAYCAAAHSNFGQFARTAP